MEKAVLDVQFPWMEWEAEELLGEGSFGSVYKARRQEFNHTFYSAIKVIRIPQNQSEIRRAKSQGMDADTMKKYFGGFLSSLIDEIVMMDTLKYVKNVVRIEDYKAVEDEDGIGWTVYIRMELLCPFDEYLAEHQMTEDEVVQLGMDICSALEGCEKAGVIHRDIKPENLFMSQMGEYKLGDFGIARQLEKTTGGLSKKGTFHYMAPEVYKGEPYGKTVDIYSLGIVMYQLLNHNRIPFMPPYPEVVTFSDNEKALSLRMAGEALERPIMAEGRLADIVLKACAYRSGDRYQSAKKLKEALQEYRENGQASEAGIKKAVLSATCKEENNVLPEKAENIFEKTVGLWGIENDAQKQHEKKLSEERLQEIAQETEVEKEKRKEALPKREGLSNPDRLIYSHETTMAVKGNISYPVDNRTSQNGRELSKYLRISFSAAIVLAAVIITISVAIIWNRQGKEAFTEETETEVSSKKMEEGASCEEMETGIEIPTIELTETGIEIPTIELKVEWKMIKEAAIGDIVTFGDYKWYVINKTDEGCTLLSEKSVDMQPFNETYHAITWENCTLREWLNSVFYNRFSDAEKFIIVKKHNSNPDNEKYKTNGGNDTEDYIYLLSLDEVETLSNDIRGSGFSWWLRSPGIWANDAVEVSADGAVYMRGTAVSELRNVRPALTLKF